MGKQFFGSQSLRMQFYGHISDQFNLGFWTLALFELKNNGFKTFCSYWACFVSLKVFTESVERNLILQLTIDVRRKWTEKEK